MSRKVEIANKNWKPPTKEDIEFTTVSEGYTYIPEKVFNAWENMTETQRKDFDRHMAKLINELNWTK